MREVGQHLDEFNPLVSNTVMDQFRNILNTTDVDVRVQYMIEVLLEARKQKWLQHPSVREELDLVESEDQITHQVSLSDELDVQDGLNVFKYDENWAENQEKYEALRAVILNEGSEVEVDSGESSDDEEAREEQRLDVQDQTNTDLVNLRVRMVALIEYHAEVSTN